MAPPFPELPDQELELELRNCVVISPPATKSMAPPFPELPELELDQELRYCVSILPLSILPLMVDIEISPPFPETERAETEPALVSIEPSVLSILILPALPLPPLLFSTYP